MSASQQHLKRLAESLPSLTAQQAFAAQQAGAVLIDVREASESQTLHALASLLIPRGYLELRIEAACRNPAAALLLMCQSGTRALLAAHDLGQLGYQNLSIVQGGFEAWKQAGLPVQVSQTGLELARYDRQMRLPEFSADTQARLMRSRVLMVGAGGLGSPAALYLAAAGVGAGQGGLLAIADGDQVELSNLHRQIIHRTENIGMAKNLSASLAIRALNRDVNVQLLPRIDVEHIDRLLPKFDLVIDGSDNFATRFLLADACVKHRKPLIYGAVLRFEGHVSVFAPHLSHSSQFAHTAVGNGLPCYRCLFREPPPPESAPNCAEAGVLGVLPGVIGSMQALQAMQLLAGMGSPLLGRLLIFDALANRFREIKIPRDPDCPVCGNPDSVVYQNYLELCAGR